LREAGFGIIDSFTTLISHLHLDCLIIAIIHLIDIMLPIPEHQRGPEKLKQLRFYRPEGKMQVLRDGVSDARTALLNSYSTDICILQPIPLFPPEIIYEIARHVEGDDFDTMQNLNRVCKVVHAITLPLLYDTLIWDKTEEHPWRVVSEPSSGRRYTR
jgi:hypothetical protein